MALPTGLNHVAMSVPVGTLTDLYRAELLDFYGSLFGWSEIEVLRLPDRLTLSVGQHRYLNLREQADPMMCSGYEHVGIIVSSSNEAERLWHILDDETRDVGLQPLTTGDGGFRSFRFRYLLPLAIEVQYFP